MNYGEMVKYKVSAGVRSVSLFPVFFSFSFLSFFFKNSSRDLNTSSPNRHDC